MEIPWKYMFGKSILHQNYQGELGMIYQVDWGLKPGAMSTASTACASKKGTPSKGRGLRRKSSSDSDDTDSDNRVLLEDVTLLSSYD